MNKIISSKTKNQKGFAHIAVLLVTLAAIGLITFIIITTFAPFKDKILVALYPKQSSHAATTATVNFTYNKTSVPIPDTYFKVVVKDNFDRANTNNGLGKAITGQVWQSFPWTDFPYSNSGTSTWVITNKDATSVNLKSRDTVNGGYSVIEGGSTDGYMEVSIPKMVPYTRIVFRYKDPNNYYFLERGYINTLQPNLFAYMLYRRANGVDKFLNEATRDNSSLPLDNDKIRIQSLGDNILVYKNGIRIIGVNDNSVKGTKYGFGQLQTWGAHFDNFIFATPLQTTTVDKLPGLKETAPQITFTQLPNTGSYFKLVSITVKPSNNFSFWEAHLYAKDLKTGNSDEIKPSQSKLNSNIYTFNWPTYNPNDGYELTAEVKGEKAYTVDGIAKATINPIPTPSPVGKNIPGITISYFNKDTKQLFSADDSTVGRGQYIRVTVTPTTLKNINYVGFYTLAAGHKSPDKYLLKPNLGTSFYFDEMMPCAGNVKDIPHEFHIVIGTTDRKGDGETYRTFTPLPNPKKYGC